ncbi:MAG: hypothetical protein JXQ65_08330 [Candidatus Marinimicrobia bacterium]|nr:hypothetical protein [Candidatus Neomarinimicrobiota bacterium]
MKKYKIILTLLIFSMICFGKAKKIEDFAFVNLGYVQSQSKNWNAGFGGHVELGSGRWGLRAFWTRVTLETEINNMIINAGAPEFDHYSTLFGMLLVQKIYLMEINQFFFMNISIGAGAGFFEKKVEVEKQFEPLLRHFNVNVTDVGVTGASALMGFDVGVGPVAASCSYYFFKGILFGDQLEKRLTLTLGFIL